MAGDILNDIIAKCLDLEKTVAEVFHLLAADAEGDQDRAFWAGLAEGTRHYEAACATILEAAIQQSAPLVFYRPDETLVEVCDMLARVDALRQRYAATPSRGAAVVLAYRLQFYLLHPACVALLRTAKELSGDQRHEDEYASYLQRFINGTCASMTTPEMELLGEMLPRLWEEIRQLALHSYHDPLTGVLTRTGFFRTVTPLAFAAQRNASNIGILLLDIDYFKLVGESYGHQTGDRVLKLVADIITDQLRRSDVVGRYDGDEFIAYLSPVEPGSLTAIAENLRARIQAETERIVPVTVSIGVSQGILDNGVEKGLERLVRKADEGQMQAKYTGKNKVVSK